MHLESFLSPADARRVTRTWARLCRHDISALVLTGSFALEWHLRCHGCTQQPRPLNDIDFLIESFDLLPKTLSADFLMGHVHPSDAPAKTLMQCVEPRTAVRVDVFRAYGLEVARARSIELDGRAMHVVALEDLLARSARLCLDLALDISVPVKHTRDFLQLLPLVSPWAAESVWPEHRKPDDPGTFAEAAAMLTDLIALRRDLQVDPVYMQDVDATCPRCRSTPDFPLADPRRIVSLLGYR